MGSRRRALRRMIVATALVLHAGVAAAGTITFDGVEVVASAGVLHPQNPHFTEDGMHVEAFWVAGIGTPQARFVAGHFHPRDLASGFEGQHFGWVHELHGLYLRRVDGQPFSLRSLDFRITVNKNIAGKNRSIRGFASDDVHLLVAVTFDPRRPLAPQFLRFPVGVGVDNDPDRPFRRMRFVELEMVTQVYIGSSASVDLDNIVTVP